MSNFKTPAVRQSKNLRLCVHGTGKIVICLSYMVNLMFILSFFFRSVDNFSTCSFACYISVKTFKFNIVEQYENTKYGSANIDITVLKKAFYNY